MVYSKRSINKEFTILGNLYWKAIWSGNKNVLESNQRLTTAEAKYVLERRAHRSQSTFEPIA